VHEPMRSLKLASAAVFRDEDGVFRRRLSAGWDAGDADTLAGDDALLAGRFRRKPYGLDAASAAHALRAGLPHDVARPVLAAPVGNARHCYAVVLYGGHEAGTDLDGNERHLLGSLAHEAGIAYAHVESETLRRRIAELEAELARTLEPR
jgi:hypothetical protein